MNTPSRRTGFLLLTLAATITSASAQWRGERRLDGAGSASDLSMAVSGNNHYVLFNTFVSPNWTSYLAVSQDGGRSAWTRRALTHRKWPRFDAEGDVIIIAEGQQGPGGGHGGGSPTPDNFWVEVSQDAGQTYTLTQLNTPTLFDLWGYPAAKIDGQRAYVHWSEDGGVQYLQRSNDAGLTWLPNPMQIPVRLIHELLEVDGDLLHSLQIEDLGASGFDQLTYQRSADAGLTWTTTRLDNDAAGQHGISAARIRASGSRVSALWNEGYVWNERDLFFATSANGGATWSSPLRINDIVNPRMAVERGFDFSADGEQLLAAYSQQVPAGNNVIDCYARFSSDGGATWTASQRVNPTASTLGYPMLLPHTAIDGDRGLVTWVDSLLGIPDEVLMGAHTIDAGQTWTAQQINNGKVWELNDYALASDTEGAVGVAYERTTGHAYANAIHQPFLATQNDLTPGSLFNFSIQNAGQSETNGVALVLLSATGDGSLTGGIAVPGVGDRKLLLDVDAYTLASLTTLRPIMQTVPIVNGSAQTIPFVVPAGISVGDLWAAALVLKPGGGFGSMTDTLKIN